MNSLTEENYLKTIYHLSKGGKEKVYTSVLAERLEISPASVTDKLKKLHEKKWIEYEKSRGFKLSKAGDKLALQVIRKHRLWELFLVKHLNFSWDEVHDIAEQLEHIHSDKLIQRIDETLGFPKFDPHGDPIPNTKGEITKRDVLSLLQTTIEKKYTLLNITDHSKEFLEFLKRKNINIGSIIQIIEKDTINESMEIMVDKTIIHISNKIAAVLMVEIKK